MGVRINFTNPLLISKGGNSDAMVSIIKNKALFVSKESGEQISGEHSTFANPIPRQVPHGTNLKEVEHQASFSKKTLQTLMFVQFALQIILKGNLNDLWGLFFTL